MPAGRTASTGSFLPPALGDLEPIHNRTVVDQATLSDSDLDRAFSALADPLRQALLARLATGDAGVLELVEPFRINQPAISKHLKVLELAGLISRRREAQRRPCHLGPERLRLLSDRVGSYREYWEASLDRLDDVLDTIQRQGEPR